MTLYYLRILFYMLKSCKLFLQLTKITRVLQKFTFQLIIENDKFNKTQINKASILFIEFIQT